MTAALRGRAFFDLFPMLNWRAGLAWTDSSEALPMAAILSMFQSEQTVDKRLIEYSSFML